MNIAINGFGRIGRAVFKIALENNLNVVAINDLHGSKTAAYLLKHDSIYGRYKKEVKFTPDSIIVDGKQIKVLSEKDPSKLPWKKLKVDVVVESTGIFKDRKSATKHLKAGAKKVFISAPSKEVDITIAPGINDSSIKNTHKIISIASCTTNCLVPVLKTLNDKFGIKKASMTTIHAYTSNQAIHDSAHDKIRRGRAAAINIVPTSTGAAEAVYEILPEMKGKLNAMAIRVPVATGSIIDLTAELNKSTTSEELKKAFIESSKKFKGSLEYSEEELVSSDIIGNPHASIIDGKLLKSNGSDVKVFAWYDNEYGYSSRLVQAIKNLSK